MKYPYAILTLVILLTGCSAPLATQDGGANIGRLGNAASHQGIDSLKHDQDVDSSRGRISE